MTDEHRSNRLLLIVSGPSGAGKTTITRAIERSIPGSVFSISATTRDRTPADVDGKDYHFLSEDEFRARASAGEFLETALYNGKWYGTLRGPVERELAAGRLVILDIDIQGAEQVKRARPDALAIFILPPGEQALLERLRARKRESEAQIHQRFEIAQREIEHARSCGVYDAFVVNDDLERAIAEAVALVEQRRAADQRA